ncbi:hypothetical protein FA15DRAFT_670355 [Coprinopsis marcescibilis]|uniref:TEA domain-containing protein n=1 Tax=Coprinopsis marcescibilis TaxID=230819 RepID=A0A5C3KT67_COPMA|nr:hypothetical protein FA15DRAFT_670355 [Coprinopsis marcescibilis]
MDPAEWFPGASDSSKSSQAPQQYTFVSMSTVEDLSYSPTANQKRVDAAQVAATGRRSWKTLKGRPEAVWPPALEGALIEALEEYRKIEARPTNSKHGVRYPMRNRYISDFIFEKTGKQRTAKQVGSRLQQLRDTCKDERLSLLLGKSTPSLDQEFKAESSSSSSISLSREPTVSPPPSEETRMVVYMQIELATPEGTHQLPRIQFMSNDMNSPHALYLLPLTTREISSRYGILSMFSNVVEICSPWSLAREVTWSVYKDSTLIHKEASSLNVTPASSGRVYACELVPEYWSRLCKNEDPNHITIVQVLKPAVTSSLASAVSMPVTVRSLQKEISIVYHFNIPDAFDMQRRASASTNELGYNPSPSYQLTSDFETPSMYPGHSIGQHSSPYWTPGPGPQQSYEHQGAGQSRGTRSTPHSHLSGDIHSSYTHSPQAANQNTWGGAYRVDEYATHDYQPTGVVVPSSYDSTPRASQWGGVTSNDMGFGRRETMTSPLNYAPCY